MGKGQADILPALASPTSLPKSVIAHSGLKPVARFEYQTKMPTFALV
jgi:hypothetical protein